jgi:hypothetical protein
MEEIRATLSRCDIQTGEMIDKLDMLSNESYDDGRRVMRLTSLLHQVQEEITDIQEEMGCI